MGLRISILLAGLFLSSSLIAQAFYPGGVKQVELWYKNETQNSGIFSDHSENKVQVDFCSDYLAADALFNFNPSFYGPDLCFLNLLSLEQSVSRHQFIVADLHTLQEDYALATTIFNDYVLPPDKDSSSVNTYVIHTQDAYASQLLSNRSVQENAAIYASNWDQYAQTHKFKQYGLEGESWNIVGKFLSSSFIDDADASFYGYLPEFIYFDRALTKNEETKVASYLALRYGISLAKDLNYLDSKNQKFWNKENNTHFPNRIFGVGKDVLSDLYQSQAESRHAQDYLVFGLESIQPNNEFGIVDGIFNDREFIMMGDTGGEGFSVFQDNMKKHKRTWLVQLTGQRFAGKPNYLRVNLDMLLDPHSQEYIDVKDGKLELRLLHDPYANNTQVSDFNHSEVNYLSPSSISSGSNGELYADFEQLLHLDENQSKYHQFTFVVLEEVAIKIKPLYDCEVASQTQIDCYKVAIIIEEGEVGHIEVLHPEEGVLNADYSPEYTDEFRKPTFIFHGCVGNYDITVHTASGRRFEYTYTLEPKGPYLVDLGPSVQYLDTDQPEIELNANGNINDPEARFRWYKDGVLTEHTTETLTVDQPGRYCLEVITGDKVCTYMYCTRIELNMAATIYCEQSSCAKDMGKIYVEVDHGIAPFITIVSSPQGFYQEYFHNDDLIIDELPNGNYTVTVEDTAGNIEVASCVLETSGQAHFASMQVPNDILSSTNTSIVLDTQASTNAFGNYTYHYQWYVDDAILPYTTSDLTLTTPGEYKVEITIEELDCVGVINQSIGHTPTCFIDYIVACESFANSIEVRFEYGFPPYETQISGTTHDTNTSYYEAFYHTGNIEIADIPYGDYTVRTTDSYGKYCERHLSFIDTFSEEISLEKIIESDGVMAFCDLKDPYNGYRQYLCFCCGKGAFKYEYEGDSYPATLIDASTNLSSPQDYSFEWFKNGISLGIYEAQVALVQWYTPVNVVEGEPGILNEFTVVATHTMGCSIDSGFLAEDHIMILPYDPNTQASSTTATTYDSRVYPNPNTSGATFYYYVETDGEETFDAEVELISMTGAIVARQQVRGQTSYTLPFQLITTGTYLIRTTTQDGEILIDRIIVK